VDFAERNRAEISYINDEHAEAATKNARFKLVLRLLGFLIQEEGVLRVSVVITFFITGMRVDADELQWAVPAPIVPSILRERLDVVDQFLKNPIDLEGKRASEMLSGKTRRRRSVPTLSFLMTNPDGARRRRKRRKRRKRISKNPLNSSKIATRGTAIWRLSSSGKIATIHATGKKK
jgi:replication fork protection complex subunit Tof1/Swi1